MGARKLVANIWVGDRFFAAGESPDSEFADQITNPNAWDADVADEAAAGPPPQSGKGSGRDAWVVYAESKGVAVSDDATRDDVIAAVSDAGHPVE